MKNKFLIMLMLGILLCIVFISCNRADETTASGTTADITTTVNDGTTSSLTTSSTSAAVSSTTSGLTGKSFDEYNESDDEYSRHY